MAIPTITSIVPSSGSAIGGNRVVITGSNFREYTVASSNYIGDINTSRVEVLFNNVAAYVYTISETELEVLPPAYTGDETAESYTAVDVKITNLDDDLDVIPGETVTSSAGYTYLRESLRPPTLETESPIVRITDELVQLLKRQVLANTALLTNTDYSPDGITIKQADVPSLSILGPQLIPDSYGWESVEIEVDNGDGTTDIWPHPIYHTFVYALAGGSDSPMELHRLMGAVRKFVRENAYVVINADIPSNTSVRMPLIMTSEPNMAGSIMNANYHSFDSTIELRRIPIMYLPPNSLRTKPVDILELQAQLLTGTLVETKDLW